MSNYFTITGNLTAAPELRFTPSGAAVANFTVADTPRRFNKQSNEWEDAGETLFVRCAIWREEAEAIAEGFDKGQKVTVTGKLKQRSYEKDGQKRTVYEMDAESVAGHARKADRGQATPAADPWGSTSFNADPPF